VAAGVISASSIQMLIDEEIRAAVVRSNGGLIRASVVIDAIKRAYPQTGVTDYDLEDMVIDAAARAGVAVETGRPPIPE
jgi:hypothetical protein